MSDQWGKWHPTFIRLHCSSVAEFDYEIGNGYRCTKCHAVVSGKDEPKDCREKREKWEIWEKLGGKQWDYQV